MTASTNISRFYQTWGFFDYIRRSVPHCPERDAFGSLLNDASRHVERNEAKRSEVETSQLPLQDLEKSHSSFGVVILAAGSSSRLGRPKQLVEFQNKSLLQHVIDIVALFHFNPSVLVLGANADKIRKSINPKNITLLNNENWSEGIASGIRLGVSESIKLNESLEGILFLLSDQPFVTKELIEELILKHSNEDQQITACSYKNNIGVPAIFGKEFFPQLMELEGDVGAKKIISQNRDNVQSVVFRKGSFDVDTEKDVQELLDKET